ncbi:uncharacterized protein V1513DRAFT_445105 [Lipomyces chichibuensis]|uniref:uncharacterized protein n=1 Tax=Lipomyces chichibuensis TaxID=1546026 RepID=UPI0033438591
MPSFDDLPLDINELILQHANVLTAPSGLPRMHAFVNYTRDVRFKYSDYSLLSRTWRDLIQRELFRYPVLVMDLDPTAQRVLGLRANLEKAERIYRENPELARYSQGADVKFVPTGVADPAAIRNLFYRVWVLLRQLAMSSSRSMLNSEEFYGIEYIFKIRFITVNDYSSDVKPLLAKVDCPKEFSLPEIGVPIRLKFNDSFESQDLMTLDMMMAMLNGVPKLKELTMGCNVFHVSGNNLVPL